MRSEKHNWKVVGLGLQLTFVSINYPEAERQTNKGIIRSKIGRLNGNSRGQILPHAFSSGLDITNSPGTKAQPSRNGKVN